MLTKFFLRWITRGIDKIPGRYMRRLWVRDYCVPVLLKLLSIKCVMCEKTATAIATSGDCICDEHYGMCLHRQILRGPPDNCKITEKGKAALLEHNTFYIVAPAQE